MPRTSAPPLGDQQFEAWKALLRAQAELISTLDRELQAERGLPITFFDVLIQLSAAGGRLRMSELADAVLLSRSGVTRLVDRMVRDGLVRRTVHPVVPPRVDYELTPLGCTLLKTIQSLVAWTAEHIDEIHEARAAYDARLAEADTG